MLGLTQLWLREALERVRDWLALAALFPMLPLAKARADQVPQDDPRIVSETPTIATPEKGLQCYLARPAAGGEQRAAVIVLHDY